MQLNSHNLCQRVWGDRQELHLTYSTTNFFIALKIPLKIHRWKRKVILVQLKFQQTINKIGKCLNLCSLETIYHSWTMIYTQIWDLEWKVHRIFLILACFVMPFTNGTHVRLNETFLINVNNKLTSPVY